MKQFAKILAVYILFCGLIPKTDLRQLSHLPDLIAHYQLHQLEAKIYCLDFSLMDFLVIHFINADDHQHEENDGHQDLPFHSFHAASTFFLLSTNAAFSKARAPLNFVKIVYQSSFHLKGFLRAVFHPPPSF